MILASANCGTGRFAPFFDYDLFSAAKIVNKPEELQTDNCLVIWGGADISPSLYNKPVGKLTGAGPEPSYRDAYEWALMQKAKELGIPIIGVCRGAQMLCALAGGFLVQDVTNHGRSHTVETVDGQTLEVNSIHHQMMYPFDVNANIIAYSKGISNHYLDVDTKIQVPCEPEFVHFPEVKGFAIQWHPEFMDKGVPATNYVMEYITNHV